MLRTHIIHFRIPSAVASMALVGVLMMLVGCPADGATGVSITPMNVRFGTVDIMQKSAPQRIIIRNTGTTELNIWDVTPGGVHPGDFSTDAQPPYRLARRGSVSFNVTFTPKAAGTRTGAVTLSTDSASGSISIQLFGSGGESRTPTGAPRLTVSPAALSFGQLTVGATSNWKSVLLSNSGDAPLTVGDIVLTGAQASHFKKSSTRSFTLQPSASKRVYVAFVPTAAGAMQADLSIASNDPSGTASVALSGTGAEGQTPLVPELRLSTSSLNLGAVGVGSSGTPGSVTMTNVGTAELTITQIAKGGTHAADFAVTSPALPCRLAPGSTATVKVTFTPAAAGTRTASLGFVSNDPARIRTVTLSGTGQTSPGGGGTGGGAHANDGSILGTNLSEVAEYSSEWIFVDAFKSSSAWISGTENTWDDGRALSLDSNGWVRSLASGQFAKTLMFWALDGHFPSGEYIVLYDGDGTIEYRFAATKNASRSTPGRDVINVNATGDEGIGLWITRTNPSNHVRNIRVIMPGGSAPEAPYTWYASASQCPYSSFKTFEQTYATQPFHPTFLNTIKNYKALRFMDWMSVNYVMQTSWSERPKPTDARYTIKGVPIEVICQLANTLHADPWVCIPCKANDDYVRQFATVMRNMLATDLKAYVEYSNEVWNWMFPAAQYASDRGLALGLSNDMYEAQFRFHAKRTAEVGRIFSDVYGSSAASRVVRVLGAQASGTWWSEQMLMYNNTYQNVDALAIAPYFGNSYGEPGMQSTVQGWSVSTLLNKLATQSVPSSLSDVATSADICEQYGVDLLGYEGGQHLVGIGSAQSSAAINNLFDAANRSSGMRDIYTTYLNGWKQNGGGLFMHYVNCYPCQKWGRWGAMEYLDQPQSQAPKFDALQRFIEANR